MASILSGPQRHPSLRVFSGLHHLSGIVPETSYYLVSPLYMATTMGPEEGGDVVVCESELIAFQWILVMNILPGDGK